MGIVWTQLGMALMVNPPEEGSESYEQYKQEESSVMGSLRRRAQIMTDGFNACEGVTCSFTEGAMYSFPRLELPQKARRSLCYAFRTGSVPERHAVASSLPASPHLHLLWSPSWPVSQKFTASTDCEIAGMPC